MTLRILSLAWLLLALPIIAIGTHDAAANTLDAEVVAGSVGNRAEFTLINPSRTLAAETPELMVVTRPSWMRVIGIEAEQGPLPAGASRSFILVFDVADDADPEDDGVLEVAFKAEAAFFDQPPIQVRLSVVPAALRLLSLQLEEEDVQSSPGGRGWVKRDSSAAVSTPWGLHAASEEVSSYCLDPLPLELTPGEPLRLGAVLTVRVSRGDHHTCQKRHDNPSRRHLELSLNGKTIRGETETDFVSYCDEGLVQAADIDRKAAAEIEDSVEAVVRLEPTGEPGVYHATVHTDGRVDDDQVTGQRIDLDHGLRVGGEGLIARYGRPTPEEPGLEMLPPCPRPPELQDPPREAGPLRYEYGYWVIRASGSGYDAYCPPQDGRPYVRAGNGDQVQIKRLRRGTGEDERLARELRVEMTTRECTHECGHRLNGNEPYFWESLTVTAEGPFDTREEAEAASAGAKITWTDTDLHPTMLAKMFGCGEADDSSDATARGPAADTQQVPPGTEATDDLVPPGQHAREGFDPHDPSTWHPDRDQEVAAHIRRWLSVADPPQSAVPGVDFDYDEHGRLIGGGGTTGRSVGRHDTVDYGAGVSSEARVWSELRSRLDSIDHCTLEEYVVARVQGSSIAHCRGRYGAVRDLEGVPLAEAKAEVRRAGFEVTLAPGSPAPSPEDEGTIERQEPGPARALTRGQQLTLVVHSPYAPPSLPAPDLVGLGLAEAKRRLQEEGLTVALLPGSPARSPTESETIESQDPAPGTWVEPGTRVALQIRPPFVAATTIPDLIGLSLREAKAALAAADIEAGSIEIVPGSPAPRAGLAGAVETQQPAPGVTMEAGSRVRLRIHSDHVDLRTVPSLAGVPLGEAKRRLASLGLEVRLAPGSPAPSAAAEGTVERQSPAGGASVDADSAVTLAVHSPYVAPTATPPAGNGETAPLPLPDLTCPPYLILRSHGMCVGDHHNPPSVGSRVPLDRHKSGFDNSPGTMKYGRYHFECRYRLGSSSKSSLQVNWTHRDHRGPTDLSLCGLREDGCRFGGWCSFWSATHLVEVKINGNCYNADENRALAQSLIAQVEPFARECQSQGPRRATPTPTPVRPPPTPVPPTPAPAAEPALWLTFPPYTGSLPGYRQGNWIILGPPGQRSGNYLVRKRDRFERYNASGRLTGTLRHTWTNENFDGHYAIGGEVVSPSNETTGRWYAILNPDELPTDDDS